MTDLNAEFVSSYEAAQIIGIRYEAFRQRRVRGSLKFEPVGMLGGRHVWRRSDVERYRE